jgi:hypothetical protein
MAGEMGRKCYYADIRNIMILKYLVCSDIEILKAIDLEEAKIFCGGELDEWTTGIWWFPSENFGVKLDGTLSRWRIFGTWASGSEFLGIPYPDPPEGVTYQDLDDFDPDWMAPPPELLRIRLSKDDIT